MKTIKLLLLLLFITSCSKDDVECKCSLKVSIDGTSYYYVTNVPTDCNGNYTRPNNVPQDHFVIGLVDCE